MFFSHRSGQKNHEKKGCQSPQKNYIVKKCLSTEAIVALCSAVSLGLGICFILLSRTWGRYGVLWNIDTVCEIALTVFLFLSTILATASCFFPAETVFSVRFRASARVCYWLGAACTAGWLMANAGDGHGSRGANIAEGGALLAVVLLRAACFAISSHSRGPRIRIGTLWVSRAAFVLSLVATVPSAALNGFLMLLTLGFAFS